MSNENVHRDEFDLQFNKISEIKVDCLCKQFNPQS